MAARDLTSKVNEFYIEKTHKSHLVLYDSNTETLYIEGISVPENSIELYNPVAEAMTYWVSNNKIKTLHAHFLYFNTSSSSCIRDIFHIFETIDKKSTPAINWYFDPTDKNEDMLEAGEDFELIIRVPFRMLELSDDKSIIPKDLAEKYNIRNIL